MPKEIDPISIDPSTFLSHDNPFYSRISLPANKLQFTSEYQRQFTWKYPIPPHLTERGVGGTSVEEKSSKEHNEYEPINVTNPQLSVETQTEDRRREHVAIYKELAVQTLETSLDKHQQKKPRVQIVRENSNDETPEEKISKEHKKIDDYYFEDKPAAGLPSRRPPFFHAGTGPNYQTFNYIAQNEENAKRYRDRKALQQAVEQEKARKEYLRDYLKAKASNIKSNDTLPFPKTEYESSFKSYPSIDYKTHPLKVKESLREDHITEYGIIPETRNKPKSKRKYAKSPRNIHPSSHNVTIQTQTESIKPHSSDHSKRNKYEWIDNLYTVYDK